jgi:hypothetical protein
LRQKRCRGDNGSINAIAARGETLSETLEAGTVARQIAAPLRRMIEHYRKKYNITPAEALARHDQPWPKQHLAQFLDGPPEEVTWHKLEIVARQDPDLAARRWEDLKREARDELRSGHRAAEAVEGYGADAWQRARFLAIREDLAGDWQPRNGIERQLIDTMAQALTSVLVWQERLAVRASVQPMREGREIDERGTWDTPRVTEHQAIEQAAAMVDRFNRMFLRTLRGLCNLRKVPLAVVVQNAGQVNVGSHQINLAAADR